MGLGGAIAQDQNHLSGNAPIGNNTQGAASNKAPGVVLRKRNYSGGEMATGKRRYTMNKKIINLGKYFAYVYIYLVCVSDAGSTLLCYPSPNLQRLVSESAIAGSTLPASESEDATNDPNHVWNRPTMTFLIQNHDLNLLRFAMKQAIRKATCRIYALQV